MKGYNKGHWTLSLRAGEMKGRHGPGERMLREKEAGSPHLATADHCHAKWWPEWGQICSFIQNKLEITIKVGQ